MSEEKISRGPRSRGAAQRLGEVSKGRSARVQRTEPDDICERDIVIAQRCGRQVEMRVSRGEFSAAYAAVFAAQRDYLEERDKCDPSELPISEIGLDVRTVNMLQQFGISNCGQLAKCHPDSLLSLPSMGTVTLQKIREAVAIAFGLQSGQEG